MRRLSLVILCVAPLALLLGQEQPVAPLGPRPVTVPSLPEDRPQTVDRGDDLVRRLRQAIDSRDSRISELLAEGQGGLPVTDARQVPEADDARIARDDSWRELEATIAALASEERRSPDQLDTPADLVDDLILRGLRASNRLDVARSYKALVEQADEVDLDDLRAGRAALDLIDPEILDPHERPQYTYLHFWFARELALRIAGPERSDLVATARDAHEELVTRWPGSSLVVGATSLLEAMERDLAENPTL